MTDEKTVSRRYVHIELSNGRFYRLPALAQTYKQAALVAMKFIVQTDESDLDTGAVGMAADGFVVSIRKTEDTTKPLQLNEKDSETLVTALNMWPTRSFAEDQQANAMKQRILELFPGEQK